MAFGQSSLRLTISADTSRALRAVQGLSREIAKLDKQFALDAKQRGELSPTSKGKKEKEKESGGGSGLLAGGLQLGVFAALGLMLRKSIEAGFKTGAQGLAKSIPTTLELESAAFRAEVNDFAKSIDTFNSIDLGAGIKEAVITFDESTGQFINSLTNTPIQGDDELLRLLATKLGVDPSDLKKVLEQGLDLKEATKLVKAGLPAKFNEQQLADIKNISFEVETSAVQKLFDTPINIDPDEYIYRIEKALKNPAFRDAVIKYDKTTKTLVDGLGQPITGDTKLLELLGKELGIDTGTLSQILEDGISLNDAAGLAANGVPIKFSPEQLEEIQNISLSIDVSPVEQLLGRKIEVDVDSLVKRLNEQTIKIDTEELQKQIEIFAKFAKSQGTLPETSQSQDTPAKLQEFEDVRQFDGLAAKLEKQLDEIAPAVKAANLRIVNQIGGPLEDAVTIGAKALKAAIVQLEKALEVGDTTSFVIAAENATKLSNALADIETAFRSTTQNVQDFGSFIDTLNNSPGATPLSDDEIKNINRDIAPNNPVPEAPETPLLKKLGVAAKEAERALTNFAGKLNKADIRDIIQDALRGITGSSTPQQDPFVEIRQSLGDFTETIDVTNPLNPQIIDESENQNIPDDAFDRGLRSSAAVLLAMAETMGDRNAGALEKAVRLGAAAIVGAVAVPGATVGLDPRGGAELAAAKFASPLETLKQDASILSESLKKLTTIFGVSTKHLTENADALAVARTQYIAEYKALQSQTVDIAPTAALKALPPAAESFEPGTVGETEIRAVENSLGALGEFYRKLQIEERKLLGQRADALREFRDRLLSRVGGIVKGKEGGIIDTAKTSFNKGNRPLPEFGGDEVSTEAIRLAAELAALTTAIVVFGSEIESQQANADDISMADFDINELKLTPDEPDYVVPDTQSEVELQLSISKDHLYSEVKDTIGLINRQFDTKTFLMKAAFKVQGVAVNDLSAELLKEAQRFDLTAIQLGVDITFAEIDWSRLEDLEVPPELKQIAYNADLLIEAKQQGKGVIPNPLGDFTSGIEAGRQEALAAAHKAGLDTGNSLIDGFAEGTDSNSPSRKAIAEMKNFADGIKVGDATYLQGIKDIAEKRGREFSKALGDGLDNGDIEAQIAAIRGTLSQDFPKFAAGTLVSEADIQNVVGTLEGALSAIESTGLDVGIDDLGLEQYADSVIALLKRAEEQSKDIGVPKAALDRILAMTKAAEASAKKIRALRETDPQAFGTAPTQEGRAQDRVVNQRVGTEGTGIPGFNRIRKDAQDKGFEAGQVFVNAFQGAGLDQIFDQTAGQLGTSFGGVLSGLSQALGDITGKLLSSKAVALGVGVGISAALIGVTAAILPLAIRLEQLDARFKSVGLSGENELGKLQNLAKELRVDFEQLAELRINVEAALKGTDIEVNANELVKDFARVSRGFSLDPERQQRVQVGLTQGLSKGVASQEEIRQQIGEALPGFVNAIAKAMDTTVAEANRKIATGTVSSQVFVDAIGVLEQQVSESGGVDAATNTLESEIALLQTNLKLLAVEFAEFPLGAAKLLFKGLNSLASAINFLLPVIKTTLGGIFVASVVATTGSLFAFTKGLVLSTQAMGFMAAVSSKSPLLAKLLGSFGPLSLAAAGLTSAFLLLKELLSESISDVARSLRDFTNKVNTKNANEKPDKKEVEKARKSSVGESTGNVFKDFFDSFNRIDDAVANFYESIGLDSAAKRIRADAEAESFSRQQEKKNIEEKENFSKTVSKELDVLVNLKPEEVEAAASQIDDLVNRKEGLETEIALKIAAGASESEVAGLEESVASLDAQIAAISSQSFGFDSIADAQSFIEEAQNEVNKLKEESLTKNPEELAVTKQIIAEKQKQIDRAKQLIKIYERQVNVQKTLLEFEKAKAGEVDREFQLDADLTPAIVELNRLQANFEILPDEAKVKFSLVGAKQAEIELGSVRQTASELQAAFDQDANANSFLTQLGVDVSELEEGADSLSAVTAESLAVFENAANNADESTAAAFARFKPLVDIAKEYRANQTEINGKTREWAEKTREVAEANRDLLAGLRHVGREVESIVAHFEDTKLALDVEFSGRREDLFNTRGPKEDIERGESQISQDRIERDIELFETYQRALEAVIGVLSLEEKERIRTLLEGKSLNAATQSEIQAVLQTLAQLREEGKPESANVEEAFKAQSQANSVDRDIASSRESLAKARRDEFDKEQDRLKEENDRKRQLKDAIRGIADSFESLSKSLRDLVFSLQEEIRSLRQEIRKVEQEIAGKSLVAEFKNDFGALFKGSFLETITDELLSGAQEINDAFNSQEDREAKGIAEVRRLEDQLSEARKNRDKAIEDVTKTEEKLLEDYQKNTKAIAVSAATGEKAQLQAEYNAIVDAGDEALSPDKLKRAGELFLALTGSLSGLDAAGKKLGVTFIQEGDTRSKLNSLLDAEGQAKLKAAEEELELANRRETEAVGLTESAKKLQQELVSTGNRLKEVTIKNTLLDFQTALRDNVDALQESAAKLRNEVARFGLDRGEFARGDRDLTPDETFNLAVQESEIQYRELQIEFDELTKELGKFKTGLVQPESQDKLFGFIDGFLPAAEAEVFKNEIVKAGNDLARLGPIIDELQGRLAGQRPTEQDLGSNIASKDKTRDLANASKEIAFKEQEKNTRIQSLTGNPNTGSFFQPQRSAVLQEIEFQKSTAALREMLAVGTAVGTEADRIRANFQALDEVQLDNLRAESEFLGNALKDALTSGITTLFSDIISGSKSASEAFQDFAASLLQAIAQIAAQILAQELILAIFGKGRGGDDEDSDSDSGGGGLLGSIIGLFGGFFKDGGEVGHGSVSGDLSSALRKEGSGARVIVAHEGERLLSAKTGEAQAFAQFERSGAWDEVKKGNVYSNGGNVGSVSNTASSAFSHRANSSTSSTSNINMNIYGVQDADSFRKSKSQYHAKLGKEIQKAGRRSA